jgi:hypothetical protein
MYDIPRRPKPPLIRLSEAQEQLDLIAEVVIQRSIIFPPGPQPTWAYRHFNWRGWVRRWRIRRRHLAIWDAAELITEGRDLLSYIADTPGQIPLDELVELERTVATLINVTLPAVKATAYPVEPAREAPPVDQPALDGGTLDQNPPTTTDTMENHDGR